LKDTGSESKAHITLRNLGEKTSFIELDTPTMTDEQMVALETEINQQIRTGIAVFPTLYDNKEDPALKGLTKVVCLKIQLYMKSMF